MKYEFGTKYDVKAVADDKIQLQDQVVYAKASEDGHVVAALDPAKLKTGDLGFLKAIGVSPAHPDDNTKSISEHTGEEGFLGKVASFFHGDSSPSASEDDDDESEDSSDDSDDDDEDEDDSHLFGSSGAAFGAGLFGGGSSGGSFGGGSSFGGFGGGSFSGGGASASF
jgi:hypothetical protein